jgi:hypothetical protein
LLVLCAAGLFAQSPVREGPTTLSSPKLSMEIFEFPVQ